MKQLEEIAEIKSGIYVTTSPNGNIKYLQSKWFDELGNLNPVIQPELMLDDKLERHLLQEGDILFASKSTRNYATMYRNDWGMAIASSTFLVLKLNGHGHGTVLPEYLTWYLNHPYTQQQLQEVAKGSAIQSIPKSSLEKIIIDIPTLEKQRKIVQIHELNLQRIGLMKHLQTLTEQLISQQLLNAAKEQ